MELIPKPKSKFLRVKCPQCDNEMIIFNHAKTLITCQNEECDHIIAEPAGGKASIEAEIIEMLN